MSGSYDLIYFIKSPFSNTDLIPLTFHEDILTSLGNFPSPVFHKWADDFPTISSPALCCFPFFFYTGY